MKKLKSIYLLLLSVLVIGAFASCAGSTDDDDGKPDAFKGEAYFTVQVAVAGDTKATSRAAGPQGGEDGDGRETAFEKEYKVNNVCVFLYSSTTGISDGEAKIEQAFYFEKPTEKPGDTRYDKVYTFEKKQCLPIVVSKAYHVLVVANAGNITPIYLNKKLSELRDAHLKAFDPTSKNFIMTSEKDATTELTSAGGNATGDGTEANPLTVNVDIERLAARIDIDPGDGEYVDSPTNPGTGTYAFDVKDASNNLVGGFVLESILPYNKLISGEFCIKRVGNNTGTTLSYLGDETTTSETDKTATNYVIDPWTSDKNPGSTPSGLEYNVRKLNDASWPSATGYLPVKKVLGTASSSFFVLDYAMENTTFNNSEEYATGLVFKGKYYELSDWDTTKKQPKLGKSGIDKYYTYTIRHSDPTGAGPKTAPMYYGIVRNNIYRIKIEGVVGEKKGMVLTIAVKKWAKYTHAETSM